MNEFTGLGDRANVVADVPIDECDDGGAVPGEVVKAVDGRWLGNFDSIGVQPFSYGYPVGFTNGTWYEQPGISTFPDSSCDCTDCHGLEAGMRYIQRSPDEAIDCESATIFDLWDYSINPQRYTGSGGCKDVFFPANFCMGAPGGECGLNPGTGGATDFGWPLVPFAFANPSSRIRVVDDTSGPEGCEDAPALEIDFSGNGNEGVTFMGDGGGHDGDSPVQPDYNNSDRSTTGWTVPDGSCWIERFWIKAVEDNDAFVCSGYDIITRSGMYPFPFAQVLEGGSGILTLDGTWQQWFRVWRADYVNPLTPPMENTVFGIYTTAITNATLDPSCPISRPLYERKGRVHIKKLHIYPCSTGVIVKRPSGRGH